MKRSYMLKRGIKSKRKSLPEEEEVIVSVPASVLEIMPGVPQQVQASHNSLDGSIDLRDVTTARSDVFPCLKRSSWGPSFVTKLA